MAPPHDWHAAVHSRWFESNTFVVVVVESSKTLMHLHDHDENETFSNLMEKIDVDDDETVEAEARESQSFIRYLLADASSNQQRLISLQRAFTYIYAPIMVVGRQPNILAKEVFFFISLHLDMERMSQSRCDPDFTKNR